MPRYFFHVHDGHAMIDHEGTELAGPDEARQQAITAAGEILRDQDKTFWNGEDWNMHVKDEVGRTVCTLLFAGERGMP